MYLEYNSKKLIIIKEKNLNLTIQKKYYRCQVSVMEIDISINVQDIKLWLYIGCS